MIDEPQFNNLNLQTYELDKFIDCKLNALYAKSSS